MSAPSPIRVDFDSTAFVVVVLVIGLTLVLKPVLFDPMLRLFEERERRIDGAKAAARRVDEKSASALATYEAEMAKARAGANAERDAQRAEALRREQEILSAARAEAAKIVEAGKRDIEGQARTARAGLTAEAGSLAREVAGRILGRSVQA